MDRLTLTPLGVVFTDYHLVDVGSGSFQLEHDFFIRQDMHIRTSAGGGGTELAEGIDFTLTDEDIKLSQIVTEAVGAGRNVTRTITITTVGYQSGSLYFSGKYAGDALEAGDHTTTIIVASANHVLTNGDSTTVIEHTTGDSERTVTLGPLQFNKGRRVTVWKMDTAVGEVKFVFSGAEKAKYQGASYSNLYIGLQGQHVTLECCTDGWYILDGVVQPVAGEPDLGGGRHTVKDANRSTTLIVDTAISTPGGWSAVVTMTVIPPGVREANATFYLFLSGSTPYLSVEMASGITLSDISSGNNLYKYKTKRNANTAIGIYDNVDIPLDANGQFKWAVSNTNCTLKIGSATAYRLGPA